MSTRRARIKAVAALPPRRKNVEGVDNSKSDKPPSENAEKILKSPKTPRPLANKSQEEIVSPTRSVTRTPPALLHISSTVSPANTYSPNGADNPKETLTNSPKSEKVPVITSIQTVKNISDVFASPLAKSSPDRRSMSSPKIMMSPRSVKSAENSTIISTQIIRPSNNVRIEEQNILQNKNDIPDDYSIPSIPESTTESITDETTDGIVPLKPNLLSKPIEQLKNELMSETAEVSFDPIVPLPSPSKVRPKLRPVPRLNPHRRNSIQGSASESEDESRRALLGSGAGTPAPQRQRHDSHTSHSTMHSLINKEATRVRNDSVCSTVSQAATQPLTATSPVKEKHVTKSRRQDMSRRMWRRRRETVKRDALTMYDLIFYNPTTNPIIPDQDEVNAKEANAKEEAERSIKSQESEDDPDNPPASEAAPVPQIKLGPNGEIILDETSLVIKQSDANRKVSSVVREGAWGSGSGRYTRAARTADWTSDETVRFYRALAAIGTDFTLMAPLFPDRSRRDLKLKFKKEERLNGAQVDKALRSATSWDAMRLQDEFTEERAEAARIAEKHRLKVITDKKAERERVKASRELRLRNSKASKAVAVSGDKDLNLPYATELTGEAYVRDAFARKAKMKTEIQNSRLSPATKAPKKPIPANPFAPITLSSRLNENKQNNPEAMATLSRIPKPCDNIAGGISVPTNIETGSLVVLRVNDPSSPSKTMLQTYIAHGTGKLTPVALPSTFLNSVVGYMSKGTPKSTVSTCSSPLLSPGSVTSQESRSGTPSVIHFNPSPAKRQRHSSYTITQL